MTIDRGHSNTMDAERERQAFLEEVLRGLARTQKELPCKYFYDAVGSRLFDAICELPEYYLTRTELSIMQRSVREMADRLGPNVLLIEYGSGSGTKTELLLDHLATPTAYIPIDLARDHLTASAERIRQRCPGLEVLPLCVDFARPFVLPQSQRPSARRVIYFPGSTIGNFGETEASDLLARMADLCGAGGGVLLGIDLQKDVSILEPAYEDSQGVTRDFNLNLLARINRELGADFDLTTFRHQARYDRELGCIEMLLVSRNAQTVHIAGKPLSLAAGEAIRTERSYKYNLAQFRAWSPTTGLRVEQVWTDPAQLFAVLYLVVEAT